MKQPPLTLGSLFAGIGGFESGAKSNGIETLYSVEIDPYCKKILKQHNPHTVIYENIIGLSPKEKPLIISGGFPCQDISANGNGQGLNGKRSGLWFEMFRIISETRPLYIVIENSPLLTIRGLHIIVCQLAEIGYIVEWQTLSNLFFGFPHKRERLYVIAYADRLKPQRTFQNDIRFTSLFKVRASNAFVGLAVSKRIFQKRNVNYIRENNGIPNFSHRVKALGNSVNPVIASYLFDCIKSHYENTH